MEDTNNSCFQTYLSHIANYTTGSQTVWVEGSPLSCYPTTSPCPTTARVICAGTIKEGTKECGNVSITNGMAVTPSGRFHPSSVIYSCNPGYNLNTHTCTRDCHVEGYWTKNAPVCDAYTCATPKIGNGTVTGIMPVFTASCNQYYTLVGSPTITCTNNTDTTALPECEAFSCLAPMLSNGTVTGTGPVFTASCNQYYNLVGNSTIACTNNTHTTTLPQCKVLSCLAPMLFNGIVTGAGPVFRASCNQYYNLVGNSTIACTNNVNTTTLPECHSFNCSTPRIEHGHFDGTVPIWNAVCDIGYKLNGNKSVICYAQNQTTSLPECQPYNCSGATIPNGHPIQSQAGIANRHTYRCNVGYKMTYVQTICVNDIDAVPVVECKKTACNSSNAVQNGYIAGVQSGLQDESVSLKCHRGFQLVGDGQAVCQANGSWSHNTSCKASSCNVLKVPNGKFVRVNNPTNDTANVTCNPGYKIKGPHQVVCRAPYWSALPECQAVPCGTLMGIEHGSVVVGKVPPTIGTRAIFICNDGFYLRGNRTTVCQTTGNWSVADRSCEDAEKVVGTDSCGSTNTIYIAIIAVLILVWVTAIVALIIVYRRRYIVRTELDTDSSTAIQNPSHRAVRTAGDPQPPKPAKYATIVDADTAELTNQGDESGDYATDEKNTYSSIYSATHPRKLLASKHLSQPLEDHYNTVEDLQPVMTTSSKATDTYAVVNQGQDKPALDTRCDASDSACLYADVHPTSGNSRDQPKTDISTDCQATQSIVSAVAASPTDAQLHPGISMNTTSTEPTTPAVSDVYAMVDLKKKKDHK